jgi:hypothetical protein
MKTKKIKVVIICSLDRFANAVRPKEIQKFLTKRGYKVELLNTYDNVETKKAILNERIRKILIPKIIRNYAFIQNLKHRANILENRIKILKPDVVICESESDSYVLTKDLDCLKILDSPSPWVDELFYSGDISKLAHRHLRKIEIEIYKKSDYVAFHWDNYTNYVKKYVYDSNNFFILNWGCKPKNLKAKFNKKPKIVYLGKLDGYWNDIELLSRLSKLYDIDVYGAPKPPTNLQINYKGYAPSTDVLANYQFGVITLSKDKLRAHSFSSKQLEYMSYGLPVLTPEWRSDPRLKNYSILYNEENFLQKINEFSSKEKWQKMSNSCYNQSKKWNWDNVLKPLDKIIKDKLK